MRRFLEIVSHEENGPFLIHCRRGAERTGVADAVYRTVREGRTREEAWKLSTEGFDTLWYWRPFAKKRFKDFLKALETEKGRNST